jgi:5'-3' exonuclease
MNNIKCNLIVDLNYILMKNVFILHKDNLLYGSLTSSLEKTVTTFAGFFSFENLYLVSDSREKSWRKGIFPEYKASRKKDSTIDWDFVHAAYNEFKRDLIIKFPRFIILEDTKIEGDDWISYIVTESNKKGISNFIVSADHDIKQKLNFNIEDGFINVMSNEMVNKNVFYVPENYTIFTTALSKLDNNNIFNLNDNNEFLNLLEICKIKGKLVEVNPINSLIEKIISGDDSDNIPSVFTTYSDTGKKRGIGEAGAKTMIETYVKEIGEIELYGNEFAENLADIICEKRKVSKDFIPEIVKNIKLNTRLVDLNINRMPNEIIHKIKNFVDNYKSPTFAVEEKVIALDEDDDFWK